MSTEPSKVLLSALLSNDVDLLDEISRTISEYHFTDPTLRSVYRALLSYRSMSGGMLTRSGLEQIVSGLDAGTAALYCEQFDALALTKLPVSDARFAAQQLRVDREAWQTAELLRDASQIASGEVTLEDGTVLAGAADARQWAMQRIAEVDSELSVDSSPAGYVGAEAQDIVMSYASARDQDTSNLVLFGLPRLDAEVGGLGPGEFNVVGAPSGLGKSHFCVDLAYRAAVCQGLSVFFATSETVRATVRCRLLARHSMADKFIELREHLGIPHGLDSKLIKRGKLPDNVIDFFAVVVADFAKMEGSIWLEQSPHGQTVNELSMSMERCSRKRKINLAIDDYLALRSTGRMRYTSTREEYVTMIKQQKHLAVDYDRGNGVPFVTPWQFNRAGIEEMEKTGEINMSGLADTAEIGNTADRVFILIPDGSRDGRFAPIRVGMMKNRDANPLIGGDAISARVDYATSSFQERSSAESSSGSLWGSASVESGLDSLLGI